MLRPLRLGPRGPAVALLCACALTVSNAVVRAAPTKPVDGAVLEDGEQKVTYADGTVYAVSYTHLTLPTILLV